MERFGCGMGGFLGGEEEGGVIAARSCLGRDGLYGLCNHFAEFQFMARPIEELWKSFWNFGIVGNKKLQRIELTADRAMSITLHTYDMQRARGSIGHTIMLCMLIRKIENAGVSFGRREGMD